MKKLPQPKKLATAHKTKARSSVVPAARTSNVEAHEYNPETGHLTVTFRGGRRYRYDGVDASTAKGMDDATSRGVYLHQRIIGKHDATKL